MERGRPERRKDPDLEFFRSYAIGCGVILLVFLVGWLLIALFWLNR